MDNTSSETMDRLIEQMETQFALAFLILERQREIMPADWVRERERALTQLQERYHVVKQKEGALWVSG